ncbi:MAG: carboxypeptidase M32 [Candidatus Hodarchaeota archaeon]
MQSYKRLMRLSEEAILLQSISAIMDWDMETYMPAKGVPLRGKQIAILETLNHERITDPQIEKLLDEIKSDNDYSKLSDVQKRNVYLIERNYLREVKVPTELISKLAKETTLATESWKKAKKDANFSIFQPNLEKVLELSKKRAAHIDPDKEPFDVFLDILEPGMDSKYLTSLFNDLKKQLIPIMNKCLEASNQPDLSLIHRQCPIETQQKLAIDIAKLVGYDLEAGRIDETEHPFTTGYFNDVRITTHYSLNDFSSSFFSVLHEAGHGIYEQNLNSDWIYQPVAEASSMGIHESQSRFFENVIGRSLEFWRFYLLRFKDLTGKTFADVELEPFVQALAAVRPTKIRVAADEVTYSLHIIVRYEIERDLLMEKIAVNELPVVWNQKMEEYLGVTIKNDAEGVLQDIHWAGGGFGYFPSYTLGNIIAAQFLAEMKRLLPNFSDLIEQGKISPIKAWLNEKVHSLSNLYDPLDLVKRVTGKALNISDHINYLEKKYSEIYGF